MKSKENYDLLILGAGPAGLTASIYASRYRLNHLVFGRMPGGLINDAHKVCNFPTESEIKGSELSQKIYQSASSQGGEIVLGEIEQIEKLKGLFKIISSSGDNYLGKKLLITTGTEHQKLGLKREADFLGKGISYCATCDGMFYKDKTVAVVGGGNSALTAALYLADVAEKVYQIYRGDKLKGEPAWREKVEAHPKIEVIYNNTLKELEGDNNLKKVILTNPYDGGNELSLDGIFVEIGTLPKTDLFENLNLKLDKNGYIQTEPDQSTNIDGVWAAGDITTGSNGFRQIVTACSEAAVAVNAIYQQSQ